MNAPTIRTMVSFLGLALFTAGAAQPEGGDALDAAPARPAAQDGAQADTAGRAEKRYQEMLAKMQGAVEEIAQLYGNPEFLQVFTNDEARASELKLRLRAARSVEEIRREVLDLQKKRDDLIGDLALRNREAARIAEKLARQRAALEALASAIEQARKAVEDTAR